MFYLLLVLLFLTLDYHTEVPLVVSSLVGGHTLETSCVRDLNAGKDQPSSAGCNTQPFTLSDWFSIFIPPGESLVFTVTLCALTCLFMILHETGVLRDDRCGRSSGVTLQLQGVVDYNGAVCYIFSSINERGN